jgi:hypothetical protein
MEAAIYFELDHAHLGHSAARNAICDCASIWLQGFDARVAIVD